MHKFLTLFIIVLVTCISAPSYSEEIHKDSYQGDGNFHVRTRDYGIGSTYGYNLEFRPFFTNRNTRKSYNLVNLPVNYQYKNQYDINFEIVLLTKDNDSDIKNIPEEHEISYELIDNLTGETVRKGKEKIVNLELSHNPELKRSGESRIRNLFDIKMEEITGVNDLTLNFEYQINKKPSLDSMFIIVTLMAPTA